jgi:tetratricopeptide (TPR) repeat protein
MEGKLITLARGDALRYVEDEQQLQMSGMVSDASAIGIGHYLGAKTVVHGTFDCYKAFCQLRLRAVDVETSKIIMYSARIQNNDPVLANFSSGSENSKLPTVSENALEHLNRGKDLLAEDKIDEALREFDQALMLDKNLPEAYCQRGFTYFRKRNYDRAIADMNKAIKLDPYYDEAYVMRGIFYFVQKDYDRTLWSFDQWVKKMPNHAEAYYYRGTAYVINKNPGRALADFEKSLKLNPNHAQAASAREFIEKLRD